MAIARLRLPPLDPRRWRGIIEPIVQVDAPRRALDHELGTELSRWGGLASRRRLARDPTWRMRREDVDAVLRGWEWDLHAAQGREGVDSVRAIAWNIERGKRFDALRGAMTEHPELRDPDLLLLMEVDCGMGRSDNRHVARELAEQLGMGFVFAPSHLVLAPGDLAEREHGQQNTKGLHGIALLSRWPVRRVCGVPLPEYFDKFRALEKRLGEKRAVVAEIELPDGPMVVAIVHLDPFSPPRHRARQLRMVLHTVERFGIERVLLGGDLNTTTYDLGSAVGLAADIVHKLVRFGFDGTIAQYMTPEQVFERRVFAAMDKAGLTVHGFTEPGRGTIYYDLNDPELVDKSLDYIPTPLLRWLSRRLERWHGAVPLRMDWFAGRGLIPLSCCTVDRPRHKGRRVSDHNPLVVQLAID